MQKTLKFEILLPLSNESSVKHLKEKSWYDNNYYELKEYGDWVDFGDQRNNIVLQKYHEYDNCYEYIFGRFENDNFVRVFGYTCQEDIFSIIK